MAAAAAGAASPALLTTLFRQLLHASRRAAREGVPCTGCVGLQQQGAALLLCPAAYLRGRFRQPPGDVNDAFAALRMLPRQLGLLTACEEETRLALRQWRDLQQRWRGAAPLRPAQQLEAAEEAAWLLQRLVTQQREQQMLCEDDVQELRRQSEDAITAARAQLDELAAMVRAAAPAAFAVQADGAGGNQHAAAAAAAAGVNDARQEQLQALARVLFEPQQQQPQQQGGGEDPPPPPRRRLKAEAYEWVYDGLAPALLPDVLARRKGAPLALALAAAAVARRAGVPLRLACARDQLMPGVASGPFLQQQLPPEVAARQAARAPASAPAPDAWLLQLLPARGAAPWRAEGDAVWLDVAQNGRLLDTAAALRRYPALDVGGGCDEGGGESDGESGGGWQRGVVAVWAALARTMVLAHQRRGEGDAVAHWLYQLLALDAGAPEWAHALGGGG